MIFAVLQNGVQLLGINQFWLQAVVGAAILVTVFFYSILARGADAAERESRPARRRQGAAMARAAPLSRAGRCFSSSSWS